MFNLSASILQTNPEHLHVIGTEPGALLDTKINYMFWLSRVIISYLEEWVEEDGELAKKKNRKGRKKGHLSIDIYTVLLLQTTCFPPSGINKSDLALQLLCKPNLEYQEDLQKMLIKIGLPRKTCFPV